MNSGIQALSMLALMFTISLNMSCDQNGARESSPAKEDHPPGAELIAIMNANIIGHINEHGQLPVSLAEVGLEKYEGYFADSPQVKYATSSDGLYILWNNGPNGEGIEKEDAIHVMQAVQDVIDRDIQGNKSDGPPPFSDQDYELFASESRSAMDQDDILCLLRKTSPKLIYSNIEIVTDGFGVRSEN